MAVYQEQLKDFSEIFLAKLFKNSEMKRRKCIFIVAYVRSYKLHQLIKSLQLLFGHRILQVIVEKIE
jgi:hypothetical protein